MRPSRILIVIATFASGALALGACSSSSSGTSPPAGGGPCANPPALTDNTYDACAKCAPVSGSACSAARPVNACCAWVGAPTAELARGTGLHYFSGSDPTINLGCLQQPGALGTPKTVTVTGHVKIFSHGPDTAGVQIQFYKEGMNGALGDPIGTAVTTTSDESMGPSQTINWPKNCADTPCTLRAYKYAGVPTETPLIIKTSDAAHGNQWADFYDYNIYIANSALDAMGNGNYDPTGVAATDVLTVANTVGVPIQSGDGLLAGEVHDCGDVRLSGATVDSDQPHSAHMFYFTNDETSPLPDSAGSSTSQLGLFGALNFTPGVPIRLSAVGKYQGKDVLLGTYVVQVFPGAVTALSFRGRRPWQQ